MILALNGEMVSASNNEASKVKFDSTDTVVKGDTIQEVIANIDKSVPIGRAEGSSKGLKSTALGENCYIIGSYSVGIGLDNKTNGYCSVAMGAKNFAYNGYATAFGCRNEAYGWYSFVEGGSNTNGYTLGNITITEITTVDSIVKAKVLSAELFSGIVKEKSNIYNPRIGMAFIRDYNEEELTLTLSNSLTITEETEFELYKTGCNLAYGTSSHAEGQGNQAYGNYTHIEGWNNLSIVGRSAHLEGNANYGTKDFVHVEGTDNRGLGYSSHIEGYHNTTLADGAHAEGCSNVASGAYSHAEGGYSTAKIGTIKIIEVNNKVITVEDSSLFDSIQKNMTTIRNTQGTDYITHAFIIDYDKENKTLTLSNTITNAVGKECDMFISGNLASGSSSHVEGNSNVASGTSSHAEGKRNIASGDFSHAEGYDCVASGSHSHAEGFGCVAKHSGAHAEGNHTITGVGYQHVMGWYNVEDATKAFIIGSGGEGERKNVFTVDWNGGIDSNGNGNFNGKGTFKSGLEVSNGDSVLNGGLNVKGNKITAQWGIESNAKTVVQDYKMAIVNGKVRDMRASGNVTEIYSDGIAIANPTMANDVCWIRVLGTGESDTVMELATGDDAGAGEQIVCRQYNTSSVIAHEIYLMDKSGNQSFNTIVGTSYSNRSSKRYKDNIKPMTDEEAKKILNVDVVSFDYKEELGMGERDTYNRMGVIAEDTEKIIPTAVIQKEIDGEMVADSVDYSRFVPYLIKMVQDQQKEIEELKAKLGNI